jgi:membrane associated rhomboid family serine protease
MKPARGGIFASRRSFQWTATRALVAANVGAFFVQELLDTFNVNFLGWFVLTVPAIKNGMVWTLFTYSFFHANFWHLFANMLGLWCVGSFIQKSENRGRLFAVYGGGVLAGAVCWLAIALQLRADAVQHVVLLCLGASAGVFATLFYALLPYFNERIRVFIYFILPITLRSKWLLAALAVITLGGLFGAEIPLVTGWWHPLFDTNVAHSAHLGGALWGTGMFLWSRWRLRHPAAALPKRVIPLSQVVAIRTPAYATGQYTADGTGHNNTLQFPRTGAVATVTRTPHLEAEVNRILDKINATGLASLSHAERETLDRASTAFPRR